MKTPQLEISFEKLFEKLEDEIKPLERTLTTSFMKDPVLYSRAFGSLESLRRLRNTFHDLAEQLSKEDDDE